MDTISDNPAIGHKICKGLTPEAFMASNSWSLAMRPKPNRIAKRNAMGTVISKNVGRINTKSLPT